MASVIRDRISARCSLRLSISLPFHTDFSADAKLPAAVLILPVPDVLDCKSQMTLFSRSLASTHCCDRSTSVASAPTDRGPAMLLMKVVRRVSSFHPFEGVAAEGAVFKAGPLTELLPNST